MKKLLDHHGIKDKLIIRLFSLPTEKSKFIGRKIKPDYAANIVDINQQEALYFINRVLNSAGKAAEADRKKGDKRFTDACRNLSLHAAMYQKLQREKGSNALYAALLTDLEYIAENPDDDFKSVKKLTSSITILLVDTLKSADVVVATAAQAIRTTVQNAIPEFTALLLDGGYKVLHLIIQ